MKCKDSKRARRARRATPGAITASAILVAALGCAPQRPVLYENATMRERGKEAAAASIEQCMREAETYASSRSAQVVRETAKGSAVGGATGAVIGAIVGRPGTGAAVGAAGAATRGVMEGVMGSRELDPVQRGYVERCLREQGYDPMGWR